MNMRSGRRGWTTRAVTHAPGGKPRDAACQLAPPLMVRYSPPRPSIAANMIAWLAGWPVMRRTCAADGEMPWAGTVRHVRQPSVLTLGPAQPAAKSVGCAPLPVRLGRTNLIERASASHTVQVLPA